MPDEYYKKMDDLAKCWKPEDTKRAQKALASSGSAPLSQHSFAKEEENALFSAITTAARLAGFSGVNLEYDWLEQSPRSSLVCELVEALHYHGYRIKKENIKL